MINFSFFRLDIPMLSQTIFWLSFISVSSAQLLFKEQITNWASFMTIVMASITRASNVSAKYATFPAKQFQKYREKILPPDEIRGDFLLGKWASQKPETIEIETMNALQRNGFDMSIFRMSFLSRVNPNMQKIMDDMHSELALSPEPKTTVMLQCSKVKDYYWGVSIFYALVEHYNRNKKTGFYIFRLFAVPIIAGLAPLWAKLILSLPLKNPDNRLDTAIFYFNLLPSTFLFLLTMFFFNQARIDINRMNFIMHQLSHLISTQKKSNELIKVLPTVNFLEELSLNSWKIMRRITIDYGKKYFYRHELYLPVIFMLAVFGFTLVFGLQYVVTRFPDYFEEPVYIIELQICLTITSLVTLYMAFELLWAFALINEFFEIHTLKLCNVKTTIADLFKYKNHYFKKYLKTPKEGHSCHSMNKVLYLPSLSHIHSRLAMEIAEMFGDTLDDNIDGFFQRTSQSLDCIIQEIAVDQQYQNITILGFIITKSFVGNLFVLICSLAFAFAQFTILGS